MRDFELYSMVDFERFCNLMRSSFKKQPQFKPISISVKEVKDQVSRQQQKYIYGVVYGHLRAQLIENGYKEVKDLDEHEFDYMLREMFYFKEVRTSAGTKKIPKRLCFGIGKKDEVCRYIDNLLMFGDQIGVLIPSPTEDWYSKTNQIKEEI